MFISSLKSFLFPLTIAKAIISSTAKIIMQTPKETSIDFYINSEYLFMSSAKAYKFIKEVLQRIQNKYELKGLGLHA